MFFFPQLHKSGLWLQANIHVPESGYAYHCQYLGECMELSVLCGRCIILKVITDECLHPVACGTKRMDEWIFCLQAHQNSFFFIHDSSLKKKEKGEISRVQSFMLILIQHCSFPVNQINISGALSTTLQKKPCKMHRRCCVWHLNDRDQAFPVILFFFFYLELAIQICMNINFLFR